ncbi:MAG: phage terminase large subunit [Candidatus Moraniibacteriota bacterium]
MNQDQIIQQLISDRQIRLQVTKESHYWFFHTYFADYVKYQTAKFHRELFEITENNLILKAVIVAFRGSAKSTIVTMSYPIWAIIGKPQKKFVLIISQTQAQARLHLANIKREFEGNALLKKELGPFEEKTGEWGSTSLVLPNFGARIMVASAEQSIRGIRHGASRPDLVICDDVEDLNSIKNSDARNKTYNWFSSEVLPIGDRDTKIIIVGNLLHEDSLLMRLRSGIEKREMDGIYKSYPLVDYDGNILWPGKFPTLKEVEEEHKKIGNENAWQREFMLNIIPDDGQVIFSEWINYYEKLPAEQPNFVITGIDLAISEKDTADYTAMVSACVYGTGEKQKVYILPNPVNKRMDFPKTLEKIQELNYFLSGIGSSKIYIEDVSYQRVVIQQLKTMGVFTEGSSPHGVDKRSRLASVSSLIFSGKILFPSQGAEDLIQQLIGFGKEKHDDLADAFSILALQIVERAGKQGGFIISGAPLPDFM